MFSHDTQLDRNFLQAVNGYYGWAVRVSYDLTNHIAWHPHVDPFTFHQGHALFHHGFVTFAVTDQPPSASCRTRFLNFSPPFSLLSTHST
jgi:hypothetical protein